MTAYLRTARRAKKATKAYREMINQHNKEVENIKLGSNRSYIPLSTAYVPLTSNLPNYRRVLRPGAEATLRIPSYVGNPNPNATARNSIMDQVLAGKESKEVADEIIRKSRCLAPAFNKGAYQFITDEGMASTAGQKVK